ncbi:MAG TPA: hypothetical protein VFJ43_05405, partial [Bacteroidia bacterium]|nr:hypothetical protein [Bacteroidia bacterium]
MRRIFHFLFTRHFFPERILFISVAGGMLIDGWLTAVFKNWSPEVFLRIGISLIAAISFLFTYSKKATRKNVRRIAYCSIILLLF